ncbi:MAG: ribokinase [Acidobacteriaceae bacterium]
MPSHRKPIVVVGSINMDLVVSADRIPSAGETVFGRNFTAHPGGKGANQAVAVARLGYPVRMIGRIGQDNFGTQLRAQLQNAGVDVSGVADSECASGVASIVVSSQGENSIVVTPGANGLLTPSDLDRNLDVIRTAGILLAQLEIPLETVEYLAELASRAAVPLILDPAPAMPISRSMAQRILWITPNETEARVFNQSAVLSKGATQPSDDPSEIAHAVLALGPRGVVLKRGSRGAFLASADGLAHTIQAFQVKATDTTAAGDAFNGAFATGLMLGKSPVDSAYFAAAAAAVSVTRPGAQPSMPTMTEVEALLRSVETGSSRSE